jgi:phenylacetate-CoA ligase
MLSEVYDVSSHHGGIGDIRRTMVDPPIAHAEAYRQQTAMLGYWNSHRDEFHQRLYATREDLDAWRLRRLARLVDWAFTTSPFYKQRYARAGYELGAIRSFRDFEALPALSRDDVAAGYPYGLPSLAFNPASCRLAGTSGASGKRVQLIVRQHRADLDTVFKYRMFEFAGDFRLGEQDWLYNLHHVPWWHTSMLGRYRVFSVSQECHADAVLEHIAMLRPKVVSCVGGYLEKLASAAHSLADLGVALVNTNSEQTSRRERRDAEHILGVPVRDEYSSEEIDLISMECRAGQHHVVEDNAYVEIVAADSNGIGAVVATDLWNQAMPMIRYEQGDLAAWSTQAAACTCGSHFRRLEAIHGRSNDAFRNADGAIVTSAELLHAIELHFCLGDTGLSEFRVVQRQPRMVEVMYVSGATLANPDVALSGFAAHLSRLFGHPVAVKASPVEALPTIASYKRRTLICQLEDPLPNPR